VALVLSKRKLLECGHHITSAVCGSRPSAQQDTRRARHVALNSGASRCVLGRYCTTSSDSARPGARPSPFCRCFFSAGRRQLFRTVDPPTAGRRGGQGITLGDSHWVPFVVRQIAQRTARRSAHAERSTEPAGDASSKRKPGRARPPHFERGVRIDALAQEDACGGQEWRRRSPKRMSKVPPLPEDSRTSSRRAATEGLGWYARGLGRTISAARGAWSRQSPSASRVCAHIRPRSRTGPVGRMGH
jgi:hypothetical protein